MASYFNLTLDTTGPVIDVFNINNASSYATNQLVTANILIPDQATIGYQMKIWGDVDSSYDVGVNTTEATSQWISYAMTKQIKLSSGDGSKTLYVKVRDDVYNESSQSTDSIILDTARPVVTISGPDVIRISDKAGKDVASFSFTCDTPFVEYKVKVVASGGSAENTGTQILLVNGSTNMSGNSGSYAANTAINCTIDGADLKVASSADGQKVIKVFVKDTAGNWSA